MLEKKNFAPRFRSQRILRSSLLIGGILNLGIGAVLGLAPDSALRLLHLSRPTPAFYLQVLAVLAAVMGCYYLLAASDVRRYSGVVALAIVTRLSVATVLALAALGRPALDGLEPLAAGELLFGLVHAASWWSMRS